MNIYIEQGNGSEGQVHNNNTLSMDDMLASILKDLESAEVSLQSTSHLIEPTDSHSETNEREPRENTLDDIITKLNSLPSGEELIDIGESEFNKPTSKNSGNNCDTNFFEEELKPLTPCIESKENKQLSVIQEEVSDPTAETGASKTNDVKIEHDTNEQNCEELNPQNTSNNLEDKVLSNILFPSSNPYVNFVQDFQAQYKGQECTSSTLLALAAAKWRKMGKEEKQVYKNINRGHCRKNNRVEKLKKYAKSLQMTEESLFQSSQLD